MKGFIRAAIVATAAAFAQQSAQAQVVVWPQPAPVVWAPVAPAPVFVGPPVRHYRRPVVMHQRVPHVTTRHRPVLGGTVSRVHYRYRPVFF